MVSDAPPVAALQSQSPLVRLPRAAACSCRGSAELLTFYGSALMPARQRQRATAQILCKLASLAKTRRAG